jgi:hypothetical protein
MEILFFGKKSFLVAINKEKEKIILEARKSDIILHEFFLVFN